LAQGPLPSFPARAYLELMSGSPHPAVLVMASILQVALCLECIVHKTGLAIAEVSRQLEDIGGTMRIVGHEARCELCEHARPVFRIA
jgi:hypothetical protein